jgi:hypothetical protein
MAVYNKTGGAGDSPANVLPVYRLYQVASHHAPIRRLIFLKAMETADGRL